MAERIKNHFFEVKANKNEYEWTRKNRHSMSMEEIRESHGSEKIKEVKRQRIA